MRTASFTYTDGFLAAVPSFAGSISYYPNTMVKRVAGRRNQYGLQSKCGPEVAALCNTLFKRAKLASVDPHRYVLKATRRAIASSGAVTAPGT